VPAETISDRLRKVIGANRSPWKWAEQVLLSAGAMGRLLKDGMPDPVKLVPAMRMENLSISWLLDGYGAPFVVAAPPTDHDAAQLLATILDDEPDSAVLVAWCEQGFSVVVHTPVSAESGGKSYAYRQTTILGGAAPGVRTRAIVEDFAARPQNTWRKVGPYLSVSRIYMPPAEWAALASGYMGNRALFGDDLASGLALEADPYRPEATWPDRQRLVTGVAEPPPADTFGPEMDELIQTFRRLSSFDRHAALRMLKGLHSTS
jgi:hypothetical protein